MRRAGRHKESDRWVKTSLWLTESDWQWLRAREQSAAQVIRDLLTRYRSECTATRWDDEVPLDLTDL
jgi:hypothetical protein